MTETADAQIAAAKARGWTVTRSEGSQEKKPNPSSTNAREQAQASGCDGYDLTEDTSCHIPESMAAAPRWVVWLTEYRDGKPTKVLYDPATGTRASSTDPATWTTYEKAARVREHYTGLGFVLGDGWMGIDWDHVRDQKSGKWKPGVLDEIVSVGSYGEVSPSGTGAHVIAHGEKPGQRCRRGDLEIYEHGRFFTVSGNHIDGTPAEVLDARPGSIEALYAKVADPEKERTATPEAKTPPTLPPVTGRPARTDDEVITLCIRGKNGDKFTHLWGGDASEYGGDASAADQALCNLLAYYSDLNAPQMDRLFRRSGLMRPKWDEHRGSETYGEITLSTAIRGARSTYSRDSAAAKTGGGKKKAKPEEEEEKPPKLKSYVITDAGIFLDAMTADRRFLFAGVDDEGTLTFHETVVDRFGEVVHPRPLDRHPDTGDLVEIVGLPRKEEMEAATLLDPTDLYDMIVRHLFKYTDVKDDEYQLFCYYILYSWVFQKCNTAPYLRLISDTGKGKSRIARVVSDLCFYPVTAGGASSHSGIMRYNEKWKGTLRIDESDLSGGAENPLTKFLNLGFERGQFFILSDKNDPKKQEFFDPHGPKVIAMRQPFGDVATEGRCLSVSPHETQRKNIPVDLDRSYTEEMQRVRAHIALFILNHWNEIDGENLMDCTDIDVEPRLKQMMRPLSVVLQLYPDGEDRFRGYMKVRQAELKKQRALSWEGSIFNTALSLATGDTTSDDNPKYAQFYDLSDQLQAVTPAMLADTFKASAKSITTALTGIGMDIERRRIEIYKSIPVNGIDVKEPAGKKQVRTYTVPSPQVWSEITRRYWYDPERPDAKAPPCPEILRGRHWGANSQATLSEEGRT